MDEIEIPSHFLCPISLQLRDPVAISTGITYDRESIEQWLFSSKNKSCLEATDAVEFLVSIIRSYDSSFKMESNQWSEVIKACDEALSILYQISGGSNPFDQPYTRIPGRDRTHFTRPDLSTSPKAALKLLMELCPWGRNRIKAVEEGAVFVLVELLLESSSKRVSELALIVLDQLCGCAEGRAEFMIHGAGIAMVSKKIFRVSHAASERAVRILSSICRFSATSRVLQEMLQVGVVAKLCLVLQLDMVINKGEAREILKLHARVWRNHSCIPSHLLSYYPSS
ncbi:E3 ubiquitin-protein ligase PUB22 [Hibiscus syriacus]|uniref:U-box domain-containing protein n=1 Tax=Hibiscus syriacus TaxID=106335 RepID=A0A6A3CJ66_HIBSY|nr:E3 ubiquitin-protein ligase PUB22 [Hibiscus syriacus]